MVPNRARMAIIRLVYMHTYVLNRSDRKRLGPGQKLLGPDRNRLDSGRRFVGPYWKHVGLGPETIGSGPGTFRIGSGTFTPVLATHGIGQETVGRGPETPSTLLHSNAPPDNIPEGPTGRWCVLAGPGRRLKSGTPGPLWDAGIFRCLREIPESSGTPKRLPFATFSMVCAK